MKFLLVAVLFASAAVSALAQCTANCNDPTFLVVANPVVTSCTVPVTALTTALNSAASPAQYDNAWNTFCSSSCYSAMQSIEAQFFCCVDDVSPASGILLRSALQFCTMSKQSPTRRCGAEIGNIDAVACQATNSNDCAAMGTCEWADGMCLFKPTQANLDLVCSDCNRVFFENFHTGGMFPLDAYSKLASAFDFACNKIDNHYCLLNASEHGYRAAGALATAAGAADLGAYCNPSASSVAKRCFRALTATTAKAIARSAQFAYLSCNDTATACQTAVENQTTVATALETSAATMCASNGASNCFGNVLTALSTSCFGGATQGSCSSNCNANATETALGLGCCGPTFATSGTLVAQQIPQTGRLLLANIATQSKYYNLSVSTRNAPLNDGTLTVIGTRAAAAAAQDTFVGLQACSSMAPVYASWVSNASKCYVRPFTRTLRFALHIKYASLSTCAYSLLVRSALMSDIASKLGITTAQISNITLSGANETILTFRYSADSAAEILEIDAALAANVSMPLLVTGRELIALCPAAVVTGVYTPMVASAAPITAANDVPILPTTVSLTTVITTTQAPTSPNNAPANAISAVASGIAIALCTLIVF